MKPDANDEVAWERLKDAQRETDNRRLGSEHGLRLALRLVRLLGAKLRGRRRSAAAARDTRSSFAARFAECVGEGPMSYPARCRILRAAQMLGTDRLSVAEAMHRVGYQSESSFSKAFVRCLGCTPGAYRDSARAGASSQPPPVNRAGV